MNNQLNMPAELWKLANIVTGFAVAQGIAFCYALAKDFAMMQSLSLPVKSVIALISFVFAGVYSFAVYNCWTLVDRDKREGIWRQVTYGRWVAIWLFTLLAVFGLFAANLFS